MEPGSVDTLRDILALVKAIRECDSTGARIVLENIADPVTACFCLAAWVSAVADTRGPTDLDEVIRRMQENLPGLY